MPSGVYKRTEDQKRKVSNSLKGIKRSPETRKKMSYANKNRSVEFRKNISKAHLGKPRFNMRGDKHPMWRGGLVSINKQLRLSLEYKIWRRAVFERDKYTCIWCFKKGVRLNADHIKPFAFFPELRFAIDNGRTLCVDCHRKTSTWGKNKL